MNNEAPKHLTKVFNIGCGAFLAFIVLSSLGMIGLFIWQIIEVINYE